MKNAQSQQWDLFVRTAHSIKLSHEDRQKAVTLLQTLLIEAMTTSPAAPEGLNPKEARDDKDQT